MTKYTVSYTKAFKKNLKKFRKDQDLIKEVIKKLANGKKLELRYRDHALKGNLKGLRDTEVNFNMK